MCRFGQLLSLRVPTVANAAVAEKLYTSIVSTNPYRHVYKCTRMAQRRRGRPTSSPSPPHRLVIHIWIPTTRDGSLVLLYCSMHPTWASVESTLRKPVKPNARLSPILRQHWHVCTERTGSWNLYETTTWRGVETVAKTGGYSTLYQTTGHFVLNL